jgi:hypothetical protein
MVKTTRFLGAVLAVWLAGTTLSQAGSLYKWVGEDGSVHYSAQSPVMTKSQTLQRVHVRTNKGSNELLAPDFDSSRNIVAEQANAMNAMKAQDNERSDSPHMATESGAAKRKTMHFGEATSPSNIQARSSDRATATPSEGPRTVVDALTDPVQMQ